MTPLLYISYDQPKIQSFALRLQTLGACAGVSSYVPPAYTRFDREIKTLAKTQIEQSDAVIIFLCDSSDSTAVDYEIAHARKLGTPLTILSVTSLMAPIEAKDVDLAQAIGAMATIAMGLAVLGGEQS
jgi:hypothetical protein